MAVGGTGVPSLRIGVCRDDPRMSALDWSVAAAAVLLPAFLCLQSVPLADIARGESLEGNMDSAPHVKSDTINSENPLRQSHRSGRSMEEG